MIPPDDHATSIDPLAHLSNALGTQDGALLACLAPGLETTPLAAGTILFREGEPSDAMYVVVRRGRST